MTTMSHKDAVTANARGELRKPVLTEFGWYIPSQRTIKTPDHAPEQKSETLTLPKRYGRITR